MHSHDRTLLSRLGFQDPDHKSSKHDLACQYLAAPEQARRLADILFSSTTGVRPYADDNSWEKGVEQYKIVGQETVSVRVMGTCLEFPLTKGQAQYLTVIGFLDVLMEVRLSGKMDGMKLVGTVETPIQQNTHWSDQNVVIEVKTQAMPVGDILRQFRLYGQYFPGVSKWVLATTYRMSDIDKNTLKAEGITHIRLGESFASWAARMSDSKDTCEDVEI